jgi:acyl-CoA reductase-like NAD-dependent aldehyde dehydrogenase
MKMLIDSRWVEAADGQYFEVYNPATGAIVDRLPQATFDDARLALEAAQRGKENMKKLPSHERSAILERTARVMETQAEELSRLLAQ